MVNSRSKATSVHIPSHCAGTGHHIRAAATRPPRAKTVTMVAATLACRLVAEAIPHVNTAPASAAMNAWAAPRRPGAPEARLTVSNGTAIQPSPSIMSRRPGHHRHTVAAPPAINRPAAPLTIVGIRASVETRCRTTNPNTVRVAIARMTSAVRAAVCRVTGSNRAFPTRARPVDSDSYCGSKDSPATAGTRVSVAPSSTPSSSRVLVTSSRTPLALCSSYPMPDSSPANPRRFSSSLSSSTTLSRKTSIGTDAG